MEGKIIDVYALYGDQGNIGGGILLGIFTDKEKAERASIGRGSMDCGGNGKVKEKKAFQTELGLFLLEKETAMEDGKVILRGGKEESFYEIHVTSIKRMLDFMKFVRGETGITLTEIKSICDKVVRDGHAVMPTRTHILAGELRYTLFEKKDVQRWIDALVKTGIATLEVKVK